MQQHNKEEDSAVEFELESYTDRWRHNGSFSTLHVVS